jgi:hypothetical protein
LLRAVGLLLVGLLLLVGMLRLLRAVELLGHARHVVTELLVVCHYCGLKFSQKPSYRGLIGPAPFGRIKTIRLLKRKKDL